MRPPDSTKNVHQTHLKDPADFPDTKKPGLIVNPGFLSRYRLYQILSLLLFQSPTPAYLAMIAIGTSSLAHCAGEPFCPMRIAALAPGGGVDQDEVIKSAKVTEDEPNTTLQ